MAEAANPAREMIRHTLATLTYRGGKPLRDAPASFAQFKPGPGSKTPLEILAHICDLMEWALSIARGTTVWRDSQPLPWQQEVDRFFASIQTLDSFFTSGETVRAPLEKIFQGPIADALTHVGQLTMLRRLAGCPMRGENYFIADISAGRLGPGQAVPRREFD
jgi:hypothetical protein